MYYFQPNLNRRTSACVRSSWWQLRSRSESSIFRCLSSWNIHPSRHKWWSHSCSLVSIFKDRFLPCPVPFWRAFCEYYLALTSQASCCAAFSKQASSPLSPDTPMMLLVFTCGWQGGCAQACWVKFSVVVACRVSWVCLRMKTSCPGSQGCSKGPRGLAVSSWDAPYCITYHWLASC